MTPSRVQNEFFVSNRKSWKTMSKSTLLQPVSSTEMAHSACNNTTICDNLNQHQTAILPTLPYTHHMYVMQPLQITLTTRDQVMLSVGTN